MKPTSIIKNHSSYSQERKIRVILECIKNSNNNREAKYVNNGTSAKVTSSVGIF